jgi:hypothetical protein
MEMRRAVREGCPFFMEALFLKESLFSSRISSIDEDNT